MSKRIIIAGGGTGGHIFPAVAVADAIKLFAPDVQILFVGAKGKMEMEKVPAAGYSIRGLDIVGLQRAQWWKNILLPFYLIKSFLQVRHIFKSFQPDGAFGVGGYSTFPVLRYAQWKGIPTFIHESNSFAGKANIWLAKKAISVYVSGYGMEKFFPKKSIIITGNPVRNSIIEKSIPKAEACEKFGLNKNLITVLVVGGSLGARSINEAILQGLPKLKAAGIQIIWQTGKYNSEKYQQSAKGQENIWSSTFINEMGDAFSAADLVVSRAGAMSVTEITLLMKPSILVPYPLAAEDHQTANAQYLSNQNAAILIADNEVNNQLVDAIIQLGNDSVKRLDIQHKLSTLGYRNADKEIAKDILTKIGKIVN